MCEYPDVRDQGGGAALRSALGPNTSSERELKRELPSSHPFHHLHPSLHLCFQIFPSGQNRLYVSPDREPAVLPGRVS